MRINPDGVEQMLIADGVVGVPPRSNTAVLPGPR